MKPGRAVKPQPVEFYAEIGDILTQVCRSPYRKEPMTNDEIDSVTDRILQLGARIKGDHENGKHTN